MRRGDIILETSLGRLLEAYADYCRRSGLRESGVQLYQKLSLRSLKGLEDAGVTEAAGIGPHEVSCARLALKSNYYLSAIHTFLPVLRFWLTNRYTVPWLTEYALAILPHHVWLHILVPASPALHCATYSHLRYLLYHD